jgi:cytochrome c553
MLKGVDATPGLAGRSPSYLARQLYDFKHGARSGASSLLMQPIVAMLEEEDMIALAAYIASLPP